MFAPAYPHDKLKPLYPGVYLLHGSIKMGPGMRMNRNMLVLQNGQELILINPVRMDDDALADLDRLGLVKHVMRLGDFHGLDDAFYLDRYHCEFWTQKGQETYPLPQATQWITAGAASPLPDSEFFIFESAKYPEAALLLNAHKLLITTDSVQFYKDWSYFTGFTKFVFKLLGFKEGLNIGPPWLKRVAPKNTGIEGVSMKSDFERLLALDFNSMIAAHGLLLESGAKEALENEVARVFK